MDEIKQLIAAMAAETLPLSIPPTELAEILNRLADYLNDSLGENYKFVGIATQSSSPVESEYPVFYLAGAGAYPNYGNTVVKDGCLGVFSYNSGRWRYSILDIASAIGKPTDNANPSGSVFARLNDLLEKVGEKTEQPSPSGNVFGQLNLLTPISRKTFNLTLIESLTSASSISDVQTAFTPDKYHTPSVPDCGDYLLGKVNPIDRNTQKAVVQNVSYSSDVTRRIQIVYNVGYGVTVVTINSQWRFISKKRFGLPNFEAEGDVENAQLSDFGGVSINPKSVAKNISTVDGGNVEAKLSDLDNRVTSQKADVEAARDEAIKKINDEVLSFNEGVTPEMLSQATIDLINASGGGTIINQADDEDLKKETTQGGTEVMKFADKAYTPGQFSGLARKYLRKNVSGDLNALVQNDVDEPNTIYHIQYDYDLQGQTISFPENSILKFEGGSFNNGTFKSSKGIIIQADEVRIFGDNMNFFSNTGDRNILNDVVYAKWFGEIDKGVDSAIAINKALSAIGNSRFPQNEMPKLVLPRYTFDVQSTINVINGVTIDGGHIRKNGIGTYINVSTPNLTVFHIEGYTDCSFENIYIDTNIEECKRTFVAFEFVQAEHLYLRNVKVNNANVAYYFNGDSKGINLAKLDMISATNGLYGVWIDYGGETSWKNGIELVPFNISNNDINIRIDKGAVTTIKGYSAEIGSSKGTFYSGGGWPEWMTHNYGIYVTNNAVVDIVGCLWLENLRYTVYAKDDSVVNIYGETWALNNYITDGNAKINIIGNHRNIDINKRTEISLPVLDKCSCWIDSNYLQYYNSTTGTGTFKASRPIDMKGLPSINPISYLRVSSHISNNKTFIHAITVDTTEEKTESRELTIFAKFKVPIKNNIGRSWGVKTKTNQIQFDTGSIKSLDTNPTNQNESDVSIESPYGFVYSIYFNGKFSNNAKWNWIGTETFITENADKYIDVVCGYYVNLDTRKGYFITSSGNKLEFTIPDSVVYDETETFYCNQVYIIGASATSNDFLGEKFISFNKELSQIDIDFVLEQMVNREVLSNIGVSVTTFEENKPKLLNVTPSDENYSTAFITVGKGGGKDYTSLCGFVNVPDANQFKTIVTNQYGSEATFGNVNYQNILGYSAYDDGLFTFDKDKNVLKLTNISLSAADSFTEDGSYTSKYNKNGTIVHFYDIVIAGFLRNGVVYDFDGFSIKGNDYKKVGTTEQRPTISGGVGFQYFDTTLNKPIWKTSTGWVDATGAEV